MKAKKILFNDEARLKLFIGAEKLSQAVISTLGPRSRNVAFFQNIYFPRVVHDGVTVALNVNLKDPFENLGAQLMKQAAAQTNDQAGDGTTTATLLAYTLFKEGLKKIKGGAGDDGVIMRKTNPMELREDLLYFEGEIMKILERMAIPVKTKTQIAQIARLSAQNADIGNLVAEAIEKVGTDGMVMVEEGVEFKDVLEVQEGMEFDNGYLSPYFVTDANRMEVAYTDGYLLLTTMVITHPDQIVPIIEKVRSLDDKPLIIIAGNVVGAALQTMIASKIKAQYKLCAIMAPEFAERQLDNMQDIAIFTGGDVITPETMRLEDVQVKNLGRFRKIEVDARMTRITPKNPDMEDIEERVNALREQLSKTDNDFYKQILQRRIGRLSQSVAVIQVGGASASEIDERKERFIDAVHATKAAIQEGIVSGGGKILINVLNEFSTKKHKKLNTAAFELIQSMCEAPIKQIFENAGLPFEDWVLTEMKPHETYDVIQCKVVNAIEAGIIDPVKVTRLAVKYAISVASIMLTTNTIMADEEEDNEKN